MHPLPKYMITVALIVSLVLVSYNIVLWPILAGMMAVAIVIYSVPTRRNRGKHDPRS